MLPERVFRSSLSRRTFSSMATAIPSQRFQLDGKIWNPSLYKSVHDFWFLGLEDNATTQNATTMKRWWGKGRSAQDLDDMDRQVDELFGPALHSIGPEMLRLPELKDYEKEEVQQAEEIAAPFVPEVGQGRKGADTLLALVLLLDQMPRHMFRSREQLRMVYNHYDRLAWSVVRAFQRKETAAAAAKDSPVAHSWYRARPVRHSWLYMPLMHSEQLESQEEALAAIRSWREEAVVAGQKDLVDDLGANEAASVSHRDIVRRFGRFPHRNEALGRTSTSEETEWLKTGETFGIKQSREE